MNRKKILGFLILIVVITSSVLLGCSKEFNRMSSDNEELMMPEDYIKVGEKHNQGLEAAFLSLREFYQQQSRSMSDSVRLSAKDCFAIMEDGFKQYCNSEGIDWELYLGGEKSNNARTRTVDMVGSPAFDYIDRIKQILLEGEKSPKQLLSKLNALNKEAQLNLSESDANAVYAGTSTCYYSYLYWKENYMKWILALNHPQLLLQFDDETLNAFVIKGDRLIPPVQSRGWWEDAWSSIGETWDSISESVSDWWNEGGAEVVAADAGDAVAGAIGGAIAGSAAGGAGAGPGAVMGAVAGGCTGSISAAISLWIQGNNNGEKNEENIN